MKIQRFSFENTEIIQIYISKIEQDNPKIIEQIDNLKNSNSNISVFVNGKNDTVKVLKEMLNYEKNKNVK